MVKGGGEGFVKQLQLGGSPVLCSLWARSDFTETTGHLSESYSCKSCALCGVSGVGRLNGGSVFSVCLMHESSGGGWITSFIYLFIHSFIHCTS